MGTTPKGLPFPPGTAPVTLGASDIEALARAVDALLIPSVPTDAPPASPVDGTLWLTRGSNGHPWLFRYVADQPDSAKWWFLGGVPVYFIPGDWTSSGLDAWQMMGSGLPLHRGGHYRVDVRCTANGPSAGCQAHLGFANNGAQIGAIAYRTDMAGGGHGDTLSIFDYVQLAAGANVQACTKSIGAACTFIGIRISVTPVRVA